MKQIVITSEMPYHTTLFWCPKIPLYQCDRVPSLISDVSYSHVPLLLV